MTKKAATISNFDILVRTFKNYRRSLVILVVLGFVGAILDGIGINLIVPFISFLNGGIASAPTDAITAGVQKLFSVLGVPFQFQYLLIAIAGLFMFRAVALIGFSTVRARIAANFIRVETEFLLRHTLRAGWPYLRGEKAGYLQNSIFWDVRRTSNLLDVVAQSVQSWSGCLVYLIVALNISPMITSVTVLGGVVFLLFFRPLIKKTQRLAETTSTSEKQFTSHLIESLGGLKTIKAYGTETSVANAGTSSLYALTDAYARSAMVQSIGTTLVQPFSIIFVLGMFALSYLTGSFNLASFAATFYLIQKIFTYLQSGQASLHSISELIPFAKNLITLRETLDKEQEVVAESEVPFSFKDAITFENVSFSYEEGTPTLSEISLTIQKGGVLALIGPSGGGKTSIADLLLRLMTPNAGRLLIDGKPVEAVGLNEWRKGVGYVTQDPFLINGTVRENIRFYRSHIPDADIEEAARKANILETILELSDGFETNIGERGVLLSGGQRQRVALARVLAGHPQVLVLDEATSALDIDSERMVHEAIRTLRGSMTVLVIAHRLSTVEDADRICVVEKGRIAEEGSPEELRKNPHSYYVKHTEQ